MASGKMYDFPPRGRIYLKPFFASKDVMGRGFLERVFCRSVCLSWLWRSECPMHCWAQYPRTLQKPPLLKPPFLGS